MKRIAVISVGCILSCLSMASAEQIEGIYSCSGYYRGQETGWDEAGSSWHLVPVKMTLSIYDSFVSLAGDYHFFGTNVRNPLNGASYQNCGMKLPPEFEFKAISCDWNYTDVNTGENRLFLTDFGKLNLATMRLSISVISSDGSAEFDCLKTEY